MKTPIFKLVILLGFLVISTSCLDERQTVGVSTHPSGWMDKSSDQFHSKAVLSSFAEAENCKTCHGQDYLGGNSQVSCYDSQCHSVYPHPQGFADVTSPNFHSSFISEEVNWDITTCKSCHGVDYTGNGSEKKNCTKCHQEVDGPEACNTCHGNFKNFAPPKDLSDNESSEFIGVGAHQAHFDSTWTTAFDRDCEMCHTVPLVFNDTGHINDGTPYAEINFNLVATNNGKVTPVWDHETATCSNVFCHGAFKFETDPENQNAWVYSDTGIVGNNVQIVWNSVGTDQAACGTCHDLPPKGHFDRITDCSNCHGNVVDSDLNIIDKSLHMNGQIDIQ